MPRRLMRALVAATAGAAVTRRPATELATVGSAALLVAAMMPLGLASGEAAAQVAAAFGEHPTSAAGAPLADLLVRFFALMPLGEAGTRAHGLAALAAVVAVVLMVMRARHWPAADAGWSAPVGIALLVFSRPFLEAASTRPAAAVDLCLIVAVTLCLESLRRDPRRSSAGLALAFLCGLAAGAGWAVRAAVWPVALVLTAGALRRGERWPVRTPPFFFAGAAVIVSAAVVSTAAGTMAAAGALLKGLIRPLAPMVDFAGTGGTDARQVVAWVIDDAGVLALLAGTLGGAVVVLRAPGQALLSMLPAVLAVVAALGSGDIFSARLFLLMGLVFAVGTAVEFMSAWFGRARHAVALVIAVVLVLPPALVGIGHALRRPAWRDPALVARRLDRAFSGPSRSPLDLPPPADQESARWWRYGRAVGLR